MSDNILDDSTKYFFESIPKTSQASVCAGCGIPWEDGAGFVGDHDPLCINGRYGWKFTVPRIPTPKG